MTAVIASKVIVGLLIILALVFVAKKNKHDRFIKILSVIALSSWLVQILVEIYFYGQTLEFSLMKINYVWWIIIVLSSIRIVAFLTTGIKFRKMMEHKINKDIRQIQKRLIERKRLLDLRNEEEKNENK